MYGVWEGVNTIGHIPFKILKSIFKDVMIGT